LEEKKKKKNLEGRGNGKEEDRVGSKKRQRDIQKGLPTKKPSKWGRPKNCKRKDWAKKGRGPENGSRKQKKRGVKRESRSRKKRGKRKRRSRSKRPLN